ncbi:MAG TPA: hypothetical protein VI877_00990 [Dehalococcoidia bacterium]|nr:hypothetical protein [Dehalococcoidia bacterium]
MKGKLQRYGLMLLAGLPLLLYFSLGLVYLEQKRGQSNAFAQVRTSLELLRQPTPDLSGLEADILQAEQGIKQARESFAIESGEALVAGLLERAQRSGLQMVGIAVKPVITRKEEGGSFSVLPFSVQAAGTTGQLMGFLNSLDYPNLEVQNLSLSQTEADENSDIKLDLAVHVTPRE